MSNTYNKSYVSLHTVKHDTTILDAQKILIRTPEDSVSSRTDLIDYIKQESDKSSNLTNKLADALNVYLNKQVYKSPATGDGGIGGANILVAPANIFDPSIIYSHVMFQGSFADGYSDPVYLGMLLWDAEGNKTIVGVSEPFIPGSVEGNVIQFSFSKNPFIIPADNRIIFYFLKSSEDIALDYPNYDSPRPRIKVSANKAIYDPYGRWNDAQTDINVGFHCDGSFSAGSAWDSWPIFSLVVDVHHLNGSHLTAEQLQKLNDLNLDELTGDHIPTYEKINELINNALQVKEESTFIERFERPTGDSNTGYANAFNLGADTIPHNVEINNIQIPILNGRSTETYLWLLEDDGSSKKVIGRSTNSNTWEDNATVTWYFNTFTIPDGKRLEVYFANEDQTPSNGEIGDPGYDARLLMVSGNKDSLRVGSNWNSRNYHIYLSFGYKSVINYRDAIEQNKVDITNLQSEIQRIDNSLTELNGNIEDVEETVASHTTSIQSMGESIAEHTEAIAEIKEKFEGESESKNYAYTDTENTFTEAIKVEKSLYGTEINTVNSHTNSAYISDTLNIGRESLNLNELKDIKKAVLGQEQTIVSNMEGSGAIGQVVAARIANPFFASGTVSNVRIFHNIGHTALFDSTPRYLYLNVDGTVYRSHPVVYDVPVQYTDFRFDNINIPADYSIVDILMSTDGALENPSYTNRTGSINFSSSITYAADTYGNSRVRIYQGGEAEIGYSAIIKVEVTTGATTGNNILSAINTAVHGTVTEGLIYNTNTVNGTLDNASIKGIQYSKNHFVSDAHITSIAIPYNYQSGANNSGYLYVEIVNKDGNIISSAYSVDPGSFNDSSSGEHVVTFNFNDLYIPENYSVARLALVSAKTIKPNIVSTENCLSFRARPIKLNNNVNYDEDDCQIFASATSTQNWVIQLTVTYTQVSGGVTDDILYNDIRVNKLIKDVNNLASLSESHISKEEAQSSFANKAITETTLSETGYICELATDATGDCECDAIHYAANKIPHNILIDEIRIPVLNDSPKPLYLAVWIVSQTDAKTYIGLSDSTTTWTAGGTAIWKFTNNPINVPENYRLELFLAEAAPASGANEVPASTNYIKAFTDYSGGGTARYADRWYSGRDIRTIFVKNGIVVNHEERIVALLRRIEELEQRITELEERGASRLRRS